jgi:hypothetical protein
MNRLLSPATSDLQSSYLLFHAGFGCVTGSESQFRKLLINLKKFSTQTRTKHSVPRLSVQFHNLDNQKLSPVCQHFPVYGRNIGPSGPKGSPINIQITKSRDQPINSKNEYGTIVEIIVPMPYFSSYFWANVTISAK